MATTTLSMIPTWEENAEILLRILESGDEKGREYARSEIRRMGKIIDALQSRTSQG